MPEVMIVTSRPDAWSGFAEALAADTGANVSWAKDGPKAMERMKQVTVDLAVLDQETTGPAKEMIRALLEVSALTHTATVSALSDSQFHEAFEGLGVLARLPLDPGADEAKDLATRLKGVMGTP